MPGRYAEFKQTVWDFYEKHGRNTLPWRNTDVPYHILVSEVMLQQTQVDRVIPKYNSWLDHFPSFERLADASLSDVLAEWQGLGYNRRGKFLKHSAVKVVEEHNGELPQDEDTLLTLPGIGPYTAAAIRAFAWNIPVILVETNVRTVYLHHFFENEQQVKDDDIKSIVADTLPEGRAREWYSALMDYGSFLKKEYGNPNKRSNTYNKQSPFEGSNRQVRSHILKYVLKNTPVERGTVLEEISSQNHSVEDNIDSLLEEEMIFEENNTLYVK